MVDVNRFISILLVNERLLGWWLRRELRWTVVLAVTSFNLSVLTGTHPSNGMPIRETPLLPIVNSCLFGA